MKTATPVITDTFMGQTLIGPNGNPVHQGQVLVSLVNGDTYTIFSASAPRTANATGFLTMMECLFHGFKPSAFGCHFA